MHKANVDGGLILEGGGMRGVYTCGVLDALMDRQLWFSSVYGVSAGACHGVSYVSGQWGRAARTGLDYVGDPRYGSMKNLMRTGNYFGVQFIYEEIPASLIPFDYEAYAQSGMTLYSVICNCKTGEAAYPAAMDLHTDMQVILASSSLPMMSRMVWIDGAPYLDGGIVDSIPIARSMTDGHKKNLIILTQHRGYEKKPTSLLRAIGIRYRRYPALVEALRVRHERYNQQLALAYREEAEGRAVIIQPSTPVTIGRLEKDQTKLHALYEQGYADTLAKVQAIGSLFRQTDAQNM